MNKRPSEDIQRSDSGEQGSSVRDFVKRQGASLQSEGLSGSLVDSSCNGGGSAGDSLGNATTDRVGSAHANVRMGPGYFLAVFVMVLVGLSCLGGMLFWTGWQFADRFNVACQVVCFPVGLVFGSVLIALTLDWYFTAVRRSVAGNLVAMGVRFGVPVVAMVYSKGFLPEWRAAGVVENIVGCYLVALVTEMMLLAILLRKI
ncbi:MAG: hypothetical protein MPJ24_05075 [Pirellulaceae bacterium]|nr:hypothetical protein [Pirellulaceae bacterium]